MLGLLAGAELLAMSLWFTGSAVAPELAARWSLEPAEAAWFTGIVQLGFVAGTAVAAVLNLADLLPARRYFTLAALAGAAANAALAFVPGFGGALAVRFLTGFFLAGVYPPAMKMIATWFRGARGLAIGTIVGALTVGKAMPYLARAVPGARVEDIVLAASVGALVAAGVVAVGYRDGPFPFARRPFSWGLAVAVARHRETRLAIGGYLGHMWELYAMWTWVGGFVAASAASRAAAGAGGGAIAASGLELFGFGAIAVGGLGCVWGGWAASRVGYERVAMGAMAASGACAAATALLFGASPWLLAPVLLVWGFFVVADSAQFSALVTEVAPSHAVGTALTLQTSLGFLLTLATIHGVPLAAEAFGWRWAFPGLAIGPALGILAIRRLRRLRAAGA
ncbi:MAG TPA: MFS transporter [Gemmatimonadales bacterium]|nr:MFS transporter [Gemmatimonadales bacterium]